MSSPLFTGSSVAIVTPFINGSVNFPKLAELIDIQINAGSASIVVCGTTGESSTQTLEEHIETVAFCVKHTNGRVPVIAGAGSNDTNAALFLCQHAQNSGADALLVVTPYYNKATQKGLLLHYNFLADNVDIPIILYNVPGRTGISFSADTYFHLSKHPNIIGVKEASDDFALINKTISLCGDNLFVWSGNDSSALPIIALGGKGVISVLANLLPNVMSQLSNAALNGDFSEARRIHFQYLNLMNAMFVEVNPIPIKTAMNLAGFNVGNLRLPLCDMEPANLQLLTNALQAANIPLF